MYVVGMFWKLRKGYVLKRGQLIVIEKYNYIKIKRLLGSNYIVGGLSESNVIRDIIFIIGSDGELNIRKQVEYCLRKYGCGKKRDEIEI